MFFELKTPRDMLEKAEREHRRLRERFDIDHVFNFFVTAYHVQDYIRETKCVPEHSLLEFLQDQDLEDCRMLCNKGKHLKLRRADPSTDVWDGSINGAPLNSVAINDGPVYMLFSGEREVDVELLAERVIAKWDAFFKQNGL